MPPNKDERDIIRYLISNEDDLNQIESAVISSAISNLKILW